uniref:lipoyl(octanoyl) transferase n=1 Tax=Nelumbo nucifera TaxID=4432 RepID=A0A822ZJM3_NELNU|nr:TPA_asm: hypothetical protein HUJ06_002031 [Nelumbo nucifera]
MLLAVTPAFYSFSTFQTRGHSKSTCQSSINEVTSKLYKFSNFKTLATSKTNNDMRRCECFDLYKEHVPYLEALSWQKSIVKEKKSLIDRGEDCFDTLIILQHPSVYTLGTASSEKFLKFEREYAPYNVYKTERGGEVTYHGPGQHHKMDLHWYLRSLEEVVIRVLSNTFFIKASRLEGFTGVWVGNEKLAAIGIRVSRWITYHGLALNVTTDLTPFQYIVPCGIRDRQVGSIEGLLGVSESPKSGMEGKLTTSASQLMDITHDSLLKEFSEVFQLTLCHAPISDLPLEGRNMKLVY